MDSTGKSFNKYNRPPNNPVITTIIPIATRAVGATRPALLTIAIDADRDSNSIDNEADIPNVDSTGKSFSKYNIPANMPTAAVMIINEPMELFIVPDAFAIKANMPIIMDMDAVAPASFDPSIMDNAATAAAITPIATDIAIRLPFTSFAPLVAQIIAVTTPPKRPTAMIPFVNPFKSIKLRMTATPARMPIATDIANIVPATFAICCSLPIDVMEIIALTRSVKAAINIIPLVISLADKVPTSLQTPTIRINDTDIDSNKPPTFAIF